MLEYTTTINENGRIIIPALFRKAVNIRPGDKITLTLENNEIKIHTQRQSLQAIREIVSEAIPKDKSLVAELMKIRRDEFKNE